MNGKGKRQFQTALNILGPFVGLILVIALFSLIPEVQDRFLRIANFKSVATQSVIVALGALGMTLVIIGGGIDLSAASNIALSSVIAAYAINAGVPPLVGLVLGVLTGGLVGFVNGDPDHPAEARPFHRHHGHDGDRPGRGQVDRRQSEDRRAADLGQRAHGQEPAAVLAPAWRPGSGS